MPKTQQVNQRIRERTRKRILNAARIVFARKGSTATMAEVAAEAGVSQGLAYRYFSSKDAIVATLLRRMIKSSDKLNSMVHDMPGTPGERLGRIVTTMVDTRRKHPEFYQLMYQGMVDEKLSKELRDAVNEQGRVANEIIRNLIIEGQATGEIAGDDPDRLMMAIMACLEGLSRRVMVLTPDEVRGRMPDARILMRMLKPDSLQANER